MSVMAVGSNNGEFEIKNGWIRKKFPSIGHLLRLKTVWVEN